MFAAGVLFVKYQMEGVRERVERLASDRTGSNLEIGRVRVTGLRGVEIADLHTRLATESGASVDVRVPAALLYVDLVDLLSGRINVELVRLDDAVIEVVREPNGAWLKDKETAVPAPEVSTTEDEGSAAAPVPQESPASDAEVEAPEARLAEPAMAEIKSESETEPQSDTKLEEKSKTETPPSPGSQGEDSANTSMEAGLVTVSELPAPSVPKHTDPAKDIFEAIDSVLPTFAFRVAGENCRVSVRNLVGDSSLSLTNTRFDVFRLSDSPEMSGSISGTLGDNPDKQIDLRVRYASAEDFDIRVSHNQITPEDVNIFLPAEQQVFEQGALQPQVRLSGFPNDTIVLSLEAPYTGLVFRGQPDFLPPLSGRLSAFAQYDLATRTIRITAARAESPEFASDLTGEVSFQGVEPVLNLALRAQRLPVRDILNGFLAEQGAKFGVADLQLNTPYDLSLTVNGPPSAPIFSARAELDSGSLKLEPDNAILPRGEITLGRVDVSWDTSKTVPTGCIVVQNGFLEHKATDLRAEQIAGTLCLRDDALVLEPFTAMFTKNPLSGKVRFDLATQSATFELNGSLSSIETTPLHKPAKELTLAGTAGLRASGTASAAGATIDASVDLTQTRVDFEWWLTKPAGTGAVLHGVHIDYKPKKKIDISGGITLDGAEFDALVNVAWRKGKYDLERIRAKTAGFSAATADRCLNVPYAMAGGGVQNATFNWDREPSLPEANRWSLEGDIDHAVLTPRTSEVPVVVREAHVIAQIESLADTQSKLTINAKEASIPSFKEEWLIPLESEADPDFVKQFAAKKKNYWTYELKAGSLSLPPWNAVNFEAEAKDDDTAFHMNRFTGTVGEGTLSGEYHLREEDRYGSLKAKWDGIPSESLLAHLELPPMLTGKCTGNVDYAMDQDDPATLDGKGYFEVKEGKFSADFLVAQLQGTLEGDLSALPPSLAFSRLGADVEMKGDRIGTKNLFLESSGLKLSGNGSYISNGDMDYDIQVSLTPETAARIPAMQTYFNLEGHRLTQSELTLGFHISGPSFRPQSSVAGLPPVGVTLVSGAFEMTSDALSIVDLPRQLLVDLFKIGGGIVGGGASNRSR